MNKSSRIVILLGLAAAILLAALDQTAVATAIPRIVSDLSGLSHLSWIFTAYMLTSTITVPIYGKLSDIFGRRGFFFGGIGIFLVGSVLSGLSQNMTQLIIFRGLQGIGAGSIMVNTLAVIGDTFPRNEQARWQGMIGAVFGVASVIGPLLGGWITDNFSWRWIFYINLPVGLIAIAVLVWALPKTVHDVKDRSIDFGGAIFLVTCLVPFLLALVWGGSEYAWDSVQVIGLLAIAGLSLLTFIFVERKASDPVISPNLFRNRIFFISVVAVFVGLSGMFGVILYLPLFAQGVTGMTATRSGLVLVPMMLSLAITAIIAGQIVAWNGKYKLIAIFSMAVAALGLFWFSRIGVDTTSQGLVLRMILFGIGVGPVMPIFTFAVQNAFEQRRLGEVTATIQLFRGLGATVGTALLGGIMNAQLANYLLAIRNEPFIGLMKQFNPGGAPTVDAVDANTIQQFLSPEGQARIRDLIAQSPPSFQSQATASFNHLLETVKIAFSQSVDLVYLVGFAMMLIAFILVLFLPQVAIRKDEHKPLQEAVLKLNEGLGQSDKLHQPEH